MTSEQQTREQDSEGQVSEVNSLKDAGEAISDSQAVGGQPTDESGEVDEGPLGPNAITNGPHADRTQRLERGV